MMRRCSFAATGSTELPERVQVCAGRLILNCRVMVPEALVIQVIEGQHPASGHFGRRRPLRELRRPLVFPQG